MSVWTIGLNHETTPLALREKFAFNAESLIGRLHGLFETLKRDTPTPSVEVMLLSTCNRTEIYGASPKNMMQPSIHWLAHAGDVDIRTLDNHLYTHQENQAVRHIFRVTSGLDSMVLGETQILGQVKQAARQAQHAGVMGGVLSKLFDHSFVVAKEVRSSTAIGAHSVSMPAAGVRLANDLFDDFSSLKVLLIGAGEMISLCASHFGAQSPKAMVVANRTLEKGAQLASHCGADVMRLSDVPDRLHEFDIMISCTASVLPIIGLGAVQAALKRRRHKPIFMLDLAIPRDIEPAVKNCSDVYLYTLDDLTHYVTQSKEHRLLAAAQAEVIVDAGVKGFMRWLDGRHQVPLILDLMAQAQTWQDQELQRTKRLINKGATVDEALEMLSKRLTQKMLHGALAELNSGDMQARAQAQHAIHHFFLRNRR